MLIRRLSLVLIALLLLTATTAGASKIGFVQVDRAFATIEEGKAAFQKLNDWAEPRRQVIAALLIEATRYQEKAQQLAGVGSQEAREIMEQNIITKQREYEDAQLEFAREYEAKRDEVFKNVANRLNQVITEYAEKNGYDAVFIMQDQMVIYLSDAAQVTDEVIRIYDQRYPVK